MSRIRIKNFGPINEGLIENDGWIDIKKITLFIGNQGSGKSTIAKIISTFMWIEKALVRGDHDKKWFERKNRLKNQYLNYHRLENYFSVDKENKTLIEYQGDAFSIKYADGGLKINEVEGGQYQLPQIMYVPAERNFITYVKTPKELKLSSASLSEFLTEFDNAKQNLKKAIKMPINNAEVEYDRLNDTLNFRGNGYKLKLTEASSGFQSLVPLYLVSSYLAKSVKEQSETSSAAMSGEEIQRFKKEVKEILTNDSLTSEQRRIALTVLSAKFNKSAFINIVEEPEQNLFPTSQQQMLNSLIEFNNLNSKNKLIITTHSPYLITYLTLAVKAKMVKNKYDLDFDQLKILEKIVPIESTVSPQEVAIYQLDENGTIEILEPFNGLPSDENLLNEKLEEGNELFAQILEIQQHL